MRIKGEIELNEAGGQKLEWHSFWQKIWARGVGVMTEKMNSNKLWASFIRNIGDQCSMKDWTSCSDSKVRTSLLAQQARCKGVSHLLSFVFTRAPLMISRSAISASPQYAAACRGLRFSKSCDHTIKQGLNNCAKITKISITLSSPT